MEVGSGEGWKREALAATALFVLYAALLWVMPKDAFWHPDEGGKFIQMISLARRAGGTVQVPYVGASRDPQLEFYPGTCAGSRVYPTMTGDRVVFQWPDWLPLLTWPLYEAFGAVGLYLIPFASGWLTAVLTGVLLHPSGSSLAALAILLTGAATPIVFYSLHFMEHTPATFLAMAALAVSATSFAGPVRGVIVAILLLCSVALRVEMMAFAAALAVGWMVAAGAQAYREGRRFELRLRHVAVVLAGLLLAALVAYVVPARHLERIADLPNTLRRTVWFKLPFVFDTLRYLLVNAYGFGARRLTEGSAVIALAAMLACLLAPFVRWRRLESALVFVGLAIVAQFSLVLVFGSYVYAGRQGVLALAPYLVIAMFALPEAWRSGSPSMLLIAAVGSLYFLFSLALIFVTRIGLSGEYQMGLEGAVRYLLPLYPLWTMLSLLGLEAYRGSDRPPLVRSAFTSLVALTMMLAVTYQARGVWTLVSNRRQVAAWQQALPADTPVVTDVWWLPASIATYFTRNEMYCIPSQARLPAWVAFAKAHDLNAFAFVRQEHPELASTRPDIGLEPESERALPGLRVFTFRFPEQSTD